MQTQLDRWPAPPREALTEAEVSSARAAGWRLSLEEAVEFALELGVVAEPLAVDVSRES